MTYREVLIWSRYMQTRGSLNVGLRVESSVGTLSYQYEHVNTGGKGDAKRHIPHLLVRDEEMDPVKKEFAKWGVNYDA